jgi:hypothetical protein
VAAQADNTIPASRFSPKRPRSASPENAGDAQLRRREPQRSATRDLEARRSRRSEGYFTRVASLAMRTSWGRYPDAEAADAEDPKGSFSERLALQLANRSFWGRGGTGSDEKTPLFRSRRSIGSRSRWRRTKTSSGAR